MPTDVNDFEKLFEQLFVSEQILQNKESNDDKEITAVIAGITHHEKQQDDELTQHKIDIGSLRQKMMMVGWLVDWCPAADAANGPPDEDRPHRRCQLLT